MLPLRNAIRAGVDVSVGNPGKQAATFWQMVNYLIYCYILTLIFLTDQHEKKLHIFLTVLEI